MESCAGRASLLGEVLRKLGRLDESEHHYLRAIERNESIESERSLRESLIADGHADLARRLLNESDPNHDREAACKSCNQCLIPQMLGMPGVCYSPTVKLKLRARDSAAA